MKFENKLYALLFIILIALSNSIFANDFNRNEQKDFFCKIEKFDNCFFTGKCSKQDYIYKINYFDAFTRSKSVWTNQLYNYIPKLYTENNNNKKITMYNGFYLYQLSIRYVFAKSEWLSWFKNKTGISYQHPQNIFTNNKECGSETFNKYLSLPLPEDADLQTCFFNYQIINSKCVPYDREFNKKIFCKATENCEIKL